MTSMSTSVSTSLTSDVPSQATSIERNDAQFSRQVTRKLDWHILPVLSVVRMLCSLMHRILSLRFLIYCKIWLLNFIDRANIGNARIAGLERDLHLEGNQFNIALAGKHEAVGSFRSDDYL